MENKTITESHPDWRAFNGRAAEGVLFTNFAYKQDDVQMQELADSIPEGYELFMMTDHVKDTNEASFRCVAFVNQETKDITFATAGTRLGLDQKGIHDIEDDIRLFDHNKPKKFKPAQALNDMILDSLGDAAMEYKFHYTGHSLGAAMAEMQAADMDIKLTKKGLKRVDDIDQVTAVTFENPGTNKILKRMYEKAGLPKENLKKLNLCEFNNRNNVINSFAKQAGRTYEIVPNSQKERNPSVIQMVFEVIAKYASKISPMLGKVFSLLAPGGIDHNLVRDHSLTNFNEVFVQKAGNVKQSGHVISLEEAYSGVKPIQYDKKIADKISKMQEINGPIGKQEFSMSKLDPKTGTIHRVTFGKEELTHAVNSIKKTTMQKMGSMVDRLKQERQPKPKTTEFKLPSAAEVIKQSSIGRSK